MNTLIGIAIIIGILLLLITFFMISMLSDVLSILHSILQELNRR